MGFGCASEDAGATLALFSEVIRSPALAQPKVDLYKAQVRAGSGRSGDGTAVTSLSDGETISQGLMPLSIVFAACRACRCPSCSPQYGQVM